MEVKFKDEKKLEQRLEELHKDVSKKQNFEDAVAALNSLIRDHCFSASPSLRKLYYGVICRVATVLKTRYRYTSPGFWAAGLALFQLSHSLVSDPSEKAHLLACESPVDPHYSYQDYDGILMFGMSEILGHSSPLPCLQRSESMGQPLMKTSCSGVLQRKSGNVLMRSHY